MACRPQVEADPERLIQEIEAREIRKGIYMDKADKVQLYSQNGFTADKLMSDVRYKISAALHDAGVQSTSYGNQVLQGINK